MSLSVLIPVYNKDVTLLVSSLASLLTKEKILSEIILMDDASEEEYDQCNKQLSEEGFIYYYRNKLNKGRIFTRTALAEKAQYEYLLFLDCDVKVIRPDFIIKYCEQINKNVQVCTGGIAYDEDEPDEIKYKLHWKYGRERETKRSHTQHSFLASNFLIQKKSFHDLNSAIELDQYGHEDTLWGIELFKKGIDIRSIDNPVLHEGLEETQVYIDKSLKAVENLVLLEKVVDKDMLAKQVKLYAWYKRLNRYFISALAEKGERIFHSSIMKNLYSYDPSLRYFDWMRLAYLIRFKNQQK